MIIVIEDQYPQALADFRAAVDALLEPREVTTIHGHDCTFPCVADQLGEGKVALADDSFADSAFDSKPPMSLGGMDWEASVYRAIARLVGTKGRTWDNARDALEWANLHSWAPVDTPALFRAARELGGVHWEGLRLLHPVIFTVTAPCPECGKETSTRTEQEGAVTSPALAVRDLWAECSACAAQWWGADIITILAVSVAEKADQSTDALEGLGDAAKMAAGALAGLTLALAE